MANYLVTDTELTQVANAIRAKARASGSLTFPVGFVNTISGITEKAAATYNVSSSNQTIAANQYLAGAQTIRGVTTANIAAGNIKAGVTVKVGDAGDAARIASVAGTFTSDANAGAGDMLSGKTAYVNGSKVTGSIGSKGAATYNVSSSDQTLAAGQYLSGAQTIRRVTTNNISAGNIKAGVTVKVGDAADDDRIIGVAGTFTSDATAGAGDIRSGKTAYVNGSKITGTLNPSTGTLQRYTTDAAMNITSRTLNLTGYFNYEIEFGVNSDYAPYSADLLMDGRVLVSDLPVRFNGSVWIAILRGNSAASQAITVNSIKVYCYRYYVG